jgi:hypothetical protein
MLNFGGREIAKNSVSYSADWASSVRGMTVFILLKQAAATDLVGRRWRLPNELNRAVAQP